MSSASERLVVGVFILGLAVYAVVAFIAQRWVSAGAAPIVATLLALRHPRARFSAYVFFSALALRGLAVGAWPLVVFAVTAILVLQTSPARRAWPRLRPGRPRATRDTPRST